MTVRFPDASQDTDAFLKRRPKVAITYRTTFGPRGQTVMRDRTVVQDRKVWDLEGNSMVRRSEIATREAWTGIVRVEDPASGEVLYQR